MEQVRTRWEWGDVTSAQYEADKLRRIVASSFQPGDECLLRLRGLDIVQAVYISDYPVLVHAVTVGDEEVTTVAVRALEPRSEDWNPDPFDVTVQPDNLIYLLASNDGRGRLSKKPRLKEELGYFLPSV